MTTRRGGGGPEPSRDVGRAVSWTLVVAASALIILAGVGWRTIATLRLRLTAAELERESVTAELQRATIAGEEAARWVELVGSDHAQLVPLRPTAHRRSSVGGRVLIDPEGTRVGVLFWKVPPRTRARYEVWGMVGDDSVSLGTLTPDPDGRAAVGPIADLAATAIRVTRTSLTGESPPGERPVVLEADLGP